MILAFDTYYYENKAKTVCLKISQFSDEVPLQIYSEITSDVNEYESGAFYKRELPCILSLLKQIELNGISLIVIDGFVFLDDLAKPGLGAYLYEALERKIPIIGVAKTNFAQIDQKKIPVFRGESNKPLYVTSAGISLEDASSMIKSMAGKFRIPDLLKQLDTLTKEK